MLLTLKMGQGVTVQERSAPRGWNGPGANADSQGLQREAAL